MGNGVPLYEAAKRKILKRLETREWLPGAKLPPEGELSRELGVSVGTLRHAVGELCDEGILWRRQGSGTYVRSYRDGGAGFWNCFQPFHTRDGMPMIMVDRKVLFLETIPAGDEFSVRLRLKKDDPVIHVLRHQIDKNGEFQGIDELYLRGDYFKGLTFERFDKTLEPDESLYSFYEREFGVEIVETSNFIAWDIGTEELAKRLLAPKIANMPLIFYKRVSKTYGHIPVECRVIRGKASDVQLSFDITR